MKKKQSILMLTSLLSLSLFSCQTPSKEEEHELVINADYTFLSVPNSEGMEDVPAMLTFNHSHFGRGFENLNLPSDMIPGDCLSIRYTGEIFVQETYPGTMVLDGKVLDYHLYRTTVMGVHVDDAFIQESFLPEATLDTTNVIIHNETLEYKPLSEIETHDLFYSEVREMPVDHETPPSPVRIAALWLENPRPIKE